MFEIGNSLREARARQGLEVAQVELATKIRGKYIRALEEEQFDSLPAEPYVKGFLRTYADFLGLDGQLYVDEYDSRFVVDGLVDAPVRKERPAPTGRPQLRAARRPARPRRRRRARRARHRRVEVRRQRDLDADRHPEEPVGVRAEGPGLLGAGDVHRGAPRVGGRLRPVRGHALRGEANLVGGQRFWISIRHPKHLTLTLNGKAVSLPARKTLQVLVTPSRTALAG